MPDEPPIVIGNWKMNGMRDRLPAIKEIAAGADRLGDRVVAGLCVPATLLYVATTLSEGTPLLIGGQDCHAEAKGAHTGDVSAEMIADCMADLCVVGHSERRENHGETDADVRAKALACARAGLTAIVCIGETDEENAAGRTEEVLERQLRRSLPERFDPDRMIVAYEPVWAIGTGRVPGTDDVAAIHSFLRGRMADWFGRDGADVPLLYGGSVKPSNAGELLAISSIDGALVGGASLEAGDFLGICEVAAGLSRTGS